ncbi:hypothetical protein B0T10DRAFT_245303 [Thelonectria olida]|uniref:Secreted protein n=1 Tax=Thelonectria olida TaxID=1576542 RepID=A0A9P9AS94_9HYPO|nr:hypothetical protein B0T10DRAFT_245303 [Thelonectria olida]
MQVLFFLISLSANSRSAPRPIITAVFGHHLMHPPRTDVADLGVSPVVLDHTHPLTNTTSPLPSSLGYQPRQASYEVGPWPRILLGIAAPSSSLACVNDSLGRSFMGWREVERGQFRL